MSATPINTLSTQHAAILRRLEQAPATCAELEATCGAVDAPARFIELVKKGYPIDRQFTEQVDQAGHVRRVALYSMRRLPTRANQNLQLARDLIADFMDGRSWELMEDNSEISILLSGGDECATGPLLGESIDVIRGNLTRVIQLAGEPAPLPTTGLKREDRRQVTDGCRKRLTVFAQAALALIEGNESDQAQPHIDGSHEAGAVAVLAGIQALATTYLKRGQS